MCEAIEGIKEDASQARAKEISLRMYEKGMSVADISQCADESEETIRTWIAEAVFA